MIGDLKYNIFIQLIGLVGFGFYESSYFKSNKKGVIKNQIIACFFYGIHYLLLNAYSGCITTFVVMFRNVFFYKFNNQNLIAIIFDIIFIIMSIFTFSTWYSILPTIGVCIYTIMMTKNKKILTGGGIINSICWLIYNIFAKSYSGILSETIVTVSSTIALLGFNKKTNEN